MVVGVVVTLGLGIGLMALIFFSTGAVTISVAATAER